ncbi:MAG: hypothetical protein LBR32_08165, partial [Propionibacteriaceae bacterium]|nr:hypothetical protein [Propionibacteriaceae bacterium]
MISPASRKRELPGPASRRPNRRLATRASRDAGADRRLADGRLDNGQLAALGRERVGGVAGADSR